MRYVAIYGKLFIAQRWNCFESNKQYFMLSPSVKEVVSLNLLI